MAVFFRRLGESEGASTQSPMKVDEMWDCRTMSDIIQGEQWRQTGGAPRTTTCSECGGVLRLLQAELENSVCSGRGVCLEKKRVDL